MKTIVETFQLDTAADLRDFRNRFETLDLSTVYFERGSDGATVDFLDLAIVKETLSDGSEVQNFRIGYLED